MLLSLKAVSADVGIGVDVAVVRSASVAIDNATADAWARTLTAHCM